MNRACWGFMLACGCSAHAATPPPKVADGDRPAPTIEFVWSPVPRLELDEDPPEFVNHPEMPSGIVGSRRRLPLASNDISLSELPEASETRDAEPADRATFSLEAHEDSYRLTVGTDLLAEVEVDGFRAFTWTKAGSDPTRAQAPLRAGRCAALSRPEGTPPPGNRSWLPRPCVERDVRSLRRAAR